MKKISSWLMSLFVLIAAEGAFAQASNEALSGIKTVGGENPDYATLMDAGNALYTYGVGTGGVTFHVRPGTYEGPHALALGNAVEPICFRKDPAFPGEVLLKSAAGGTVLKISGSTNQVTIVAIKVVAKNQHAVRFESSGILEIRDCEIDLTSDEGSSSTAEWYAVSNTSASSLMILRRNVLTVKSDKDRCYGLVLLGEVRGNKNRISGQGLRALVGLSLNSLHPKRLVNNVVEGFVTAIKLLAGTATLKHNTLVGNDDTYDLVIASPSVASVNFHNNIAFAAKARCFSVSKYVTVQSNRNIYWLPNGTMGHWKGTDTATLSEWQQASGQDAASLYADPKLTPDFHLTVESPGRSLADPTFSVAQDREGDARPAGGAKDIGADEFLHPAPTELTLSSNAADPLKPGFVAQFNAATGLSSTLSRVQVATEPTFQTPVWDSAESWPDSAALPFGNMTTVNAGQSCEAISYAGTALEAGVTYYWRIRFWDDTYYEPTRWSGAHSFTISIASGSVVTIVEGAVESSEESGSAGGSACGLVGWDALLGLGLLALRRRARHCNRKETR